MYMCVVCVFVYIYVYNPLTLSWKREAQGEAGNMSSLSDQYISSHHNGSVQVVVILITIRMCSFTLAFFHPVPS